MDDRNIATAGAIVSQPKKKKRGGEKVASSDVAARPSSVKELCRWFYGAFDTATR